MEMHIHINDNISPVSIMALVKMQFIPLYLRDSGCDQGYEEV